MHPSSPWLNISMLLSPQVIKCFISDLKQGITRKLSVLKICSVYCFKDTTCFNSIEFDGVTPLPPPKRTPEGERKHEPGNQSSAVPGRNLPLSILHTRSRSHAARKGNQPFEHSRPLPAGRIHCIHQMTCGIPGSNSEIRSFTPGMDTFQNHESNSSWMLQKKY